MLKTDDELLHEIFNCIHESNGCDVKFVWFVSKGNTATNTWKKTQFIQRICLRVMRQNSDETMRIKKTTK